MLSHFLKTFLFLGLFFGVTASAASTKNIPHDDETSEDCITTAYSGTTWMIPDDATGQLCGGGINYSSDANALGCWAYTTNAIEAEAEANNCNADTSVNKLHWWHTTAMPFNDATLAAGVPAGSVSGLDNIYFDGASGHYMLSVDGSKGCVNASIPGDTCCTGLHTSNGTCDGQWDAFEADDFTAGCWVWRDDDTGQDAIISKSKDTDTTVERPWMLRGTVSGGVQAYVDTDFETAEQTADDDKWFHIAMQHKNTPGLEEIIPWVNGVSSCNGACTTNADLTDTSWPFQIGARDIAPTDYLTGAIVECFYFDRVLTSVEMQEIVLCGFYGDADGAARDAAFGNESCTGVGTPWACCTGLKNGSCASCANINTCC